MGTTAARKCRLILDNAQKVLGIELLAASQALSFGPKDQSIAPATARALELIRSNTPVIHEDIVLYPELQKMNRLTASAALVEAVKPICGPLQ